MVRFKQDKRALHGYALQIAVMHDDFFVRHLNDELAC